MQTLKEAAGKNTGPVLLLGMLALMVLIALSFRGGGEEQTDLEVRLASILRHIDGAGSVRVFINRKESAAATLWSMDEEDKDEKIVGVLIVAEGAADPIVHASLARAAGSALGIEQEQIEIMVMQR